METDLRSRLLRQFWQIASADTGVGVIPELEGFVECNVVFGLNYAMEIITESPSRISIKPNYVFDPESGSIYILKNKCGLFSQQEVLKLFQGINNWMIIKTIDHGDFYLRKSNIC